MRPSWSGLLIRLVRSTRKRWSKNHDAEQGVEADEAWLTSELRSLTPVFGRLDRVRGVAERRHNLTGEEPHYLISAVLRVSGAALDVDRLLAARACQADRAWQKGSLDRHGRTRLTSAFNLSIIEAASAAQLRDAVHDFLTSKTAFLTDIRDAGGACELDLGVMVGPERMISFHLEPELLASLAAAGIALHVTAYPCAEDE